MALLGKFYGFTMKYRTDGMPLWEDLPKIFVLVADKKVHPLVTRTFSLLAARHALELLATGSVEGKIGIIRVSDGLSGCDSVNVLTNV